MNALKRFHAVIAAILIVFLCAREEVCSQQKNNAEDPALPTYSIKEVVDAGNAFFGNASIAMGKTIERLFIQFGKPNGYIVGEEISVAMVGGVRYGKGLFHTQNLGSYNIFWHGPSIGWDAGVSGTKTMFLVYNLQDIGQIYNKYPGVEGTASMIGGVSTMLLYQDKVLIVPIRIGLGMRLGINIGYLEFTPEAKWNPF